MKNLEESWKSYRNACYPEGCSKVQEIETRQAFFAGALIVMEILVDRAANLPPEKAYASITTLAEEAKTACQDRAWELQSQN